MTDLPLPFVVNMREYEKCSTVLEKFDWMLSTQGSLRFAGHRFDEAKGEAYGVALMMFMEDYGVQLRTALALHESAKTNAEVPLPEPRISVSSYTSNGPEQMEFVTVDQLHAYAAAKTAELQAELAAARAELATEMNDAELEADQYQKCIRVLEAECARLRAFVADLAENGTRFDLNPAVLHIGGNSAPSYLGYIRRIDDSMRERADAALRGKETGDGK